MPRYILCVFSLLLFGLTTHVEANDWTRFRGTLGGGQGAAANVPTTWGDENNVAWKHDLAGKGASSPVEFDGRLYLTYYEGYGVTAEDEGEVSDVVRHLICLNSKNGKPIWDKAIPSDHDQKKYRGFIALHGYASSTPAVDESGIYLFCGTTGAVAFSHEGEQLWKTPLGEKTHAFGTANSPVLSNDLVIINASVECGDLVALNKKSGQEAWRVEGIERSWNTPLVYEAIGGREELVVNTQGRIRAFDPSNGNSLWDCEGIDDYICPSIIAQDGILYAVGARRSTTLAVKSGGEGDVTESHVLWRKTRGSNVSSPVYHDGHLYWAKEDRGLFYCANAETGEIVYEERLDPSPGRIYASPIVVDGKIIYMSREKGAIVLEAKPEFNVLAQNEFASDTSVFNASPIIANGRLILRSDQAIYGIGE